MPKDLTKMPMDKLWKRATGALEELQRRMVGRVGDPGSIEAAPDRFYGDHARERTPTPEQIAEAQARTLQARLHSTRVPASDPQYLAVFNGTPTRPPPPNEVTTVRHQPETPVVVSPRENGTQTG